MARRFLVISFLVFLISIVYFVYTRYQLHAESKNQQVQQEVTAELETPFTGRVFSSRSGQSKTESSNPEPTEEEWKSFEEFIGNLEKLEELEGTTETTQPEEVAETVASEIEVDDTGISPELEEMFIYYKGHLDRFRDVERKGSSSYEESC